MHHLLLVSSRLFAVVVGTMCFGSVVTGDDVPVESGHTQAQTLAVQSVHVTTGSFVDTEACYVAMEEAMKKTEHRKMNLEDFVNFAITYRPDDGSFVDNDDTVGDQQQQGDISSIPVEELLSTFYRLACFCRSDDCCVGSNAGIDTTGSFVGETPTVSEQSYLFQVCTQTSIVVHNQSHDSIQITPPSTTTTAVPVPVPVPVPVAVNGTTILVPPTIMNSDEQGQKNNDNSTTTTTAITEEEDRRVASIAGPILVVVVIALMIIAFYVTRRNKSDDDDDYDAAVAVLLLQEEGSSVDHHDSDDHDDDHVVIVDTAIKTTNVSNDDVMTNQMFLNMEQDGGGGRGENCSLSSSSSSVMSSSGWSSSAGLDSMNTTPTTNEN